MTLTQERAANLPVFPLPNVVLMPGSIVPLHVFEPRYRALLADCIASDHLMGIATLAGAGPSPAIHPEIGIGRIIQAESDPEGRSNILLLHSDTALVEEEVTADTPYRCFRVKVIEPDPPDPMVAMGIRSMVEAVATVSHDAAHLADELLSFEGMDLVHALARQIFRTPDQQRIYLRATTEARMDAVSDRLAGLLIRTEPAGEA